MSTVKVNLVEPRSATTLTLGASGDTIAIPAGATIANSGTATGFSAAARYVYAWRETSNQSIAATTTTLAELNAVTQSHSAYDTGTYTWTATADDAGIWVFNAQASYYTSTNNNNAPSVYIFLNGVKAAGSYSMAVVSLRHVTCHQQYLVNISTSDTIKMYGRCDLASYFFGSETSSGNGGPQQCSLLGYKL